MSVATAMRAAWRLMPDRTTITFREQTSPGVYSTETVRNCWRRSRRLVEADNSGGVYRFQQDDWFIPKEMRPRQPGPSDIVRLASVTSMRSPYYGLDGDYIIIAGGVGEVGALGCWQCTTTIPFLKSGLTDTVTIYRPTFAAGDGARNVEVGRIVVVSGVSCKIQPTPPNAAVEVFGKLQIPNNARCFFSTQFDVQGHDYLVDDVTGEQWSIVSEEFTAMLGVLMAIDIERML